MGYLRKIYHNNAEIGSIFHCIGKCTRQENAGIAARWKIPNHPLIAVYKYLLTKRSAG